MKLPNELNSHTVLMQYLQIHRYFQYLIYFLYKFLLMRYVIHLVTNLSLHQF